MEIVETDIPMNETFQLDRSIDVALDCSGSEMESRGAGSQDTNFFTEHKLRNAPREALHRNDFLCSFGLGSSVSFSVVLNLSHKTIQGAQILACTHQLPDSCPQTVSDPNECRIDQDAPLQGRMRACLGPP